jgi:Terminase large subunit, T4likevirus-type, N-terminal
LLATELRQQQVPDAVGLMRMAGLEPDAWQVTVLRSQAARMALLCCRQSGKTTVAAALALATALQQPGALVLILSPSLRQSQESFHRVASLYRSMARPVPTEAASALRLTLVNGARIISLPGTEATIRGYSGVTLLVIDEAARVTDDLYHAVSPMLAVSQGKMLALSTPYGRRGWFYQAWEQGEGWERTRVTAAACARISAAFLEQEHRSMPDLWYRSEYLCEFVDVAEQVFSTEIVLRAVSADVIPLSQRR